MTRVLAQPGRRKRADGIFEYLNMPESGKSRRIVLKAFLVQTLSTWAEIPALGTECQVHVVSAFPLADLYHAALG